MIIRDEKTSDIEAISEVTRAAFEHNPHSNQTEEFIVIALRSAGALSVSLVAETEGKVVGHIAFSPVTISGEDCGWYGVGPVSVAPPLPKQGIGKALMHEGLRRLQAAGAKGVALVGNPGYYERFGFRNIPDLILEGVPPEVFLALPFGENKPRGVMVFHEAFQATGPD